ncbi:MAG TPA: SDR family NAD(P)-dependent oxidoreductase [Gemmatimonadaceae bacterium]|nr:SDR family NAD(P)-dependent oxidoreductase [Gemmatimonadaceae bacterium]
MSRSPTAVVTGASRGIGRAIAKRLAARHHVVALARDGEALEALAAEIGREGGRCTPLVADVTEADGMVRALGPLEVDVLVNNAGVGVMKPLVELTVEEWRTMMAVNLDGVFHATRAVLPGMIARRRGHIVNIASIAGRSAFPRGTAYTATKHGLLGFSESLMLEVREHGVRVSAVLPGSVATEFGGATSHADWKLRPEDVADSVEHLLAAPPRVLVHSVEVRAAQPPSKGP